MATSLFFVLCLGAVLVASPSAALQLPSIQRTELISPECRVQTDTLLEGQIFVKQQLAAMQKSLAAIELALGICPVGWTKSEDSCFLLNGEALTVAEALEACQRHNPLARLASLREDEHRELVHSLVNDSPYQQAWIGLHRVPYGWQWSDGGLLEDEGIWLPYQPDNNGGEDCVMYDRTERYPGWTQGWSDERCVLTAPSVCEISHKSRSSNDD